MGHQSNDSGSFSALSRHEEYYINGGDLYFLVEHVQFRVHRYFFERESPRFRGQLTTPASPGASRQGTSESSAIVLDNVRSADFAKFLWVFYNPKYSLYKASIDDWTIILDLAHRWSFGEVIKLAVRELEKLPMADVDRIATYHKYEIDKNLLIPRYAALCDREDPLTLREGLQLGMEITLMIARAREYARANPTADGARSPTAAGIREEEMHGLVRQLFEIAPPESSEDQEKEGEKEGTAAPAAATTSTTARGASPVGRAAGKAATTAATTATSTTKPTMKPITTTAANTTTNSSSTTGTAKSNSASTPSGTNTTTTANGSANGSATGDNSKGTDAAAGTPANTTESASAVGSGSAAEAEETGGESTNGTAKPGGLTDLDDLFRSPTPTTTKSKRGGYGRNNK